MAKALVFFLSTTIEVLFVLFIILDIIQYSLGVFQLSGVLWDAYNGVAAYKYMTPFQCILIGTSGLIYLVGISIWELVQLSEFLKTKHMYDNVQLKFFLMKILIAIPLVIVPIISLFFIELPLLFTIACIIINFLQLTWAIQIYNKIKKTLSSYETPSNGVFENVEAWKTSSSTNFELETNPQYRENP